MTTLPDKLNNLLVKHSLDYGVCIDSSGDIISTCGSVDQFPYMGLVKQLLGSTEAVKCTFEFILGRTLLPQMYRQGEVIAFIDRVTQEHVVALFGRVAPENDRITEINRIRKDIGKSITLEFGTNV